MTWFDYVLIALWIFSMLVSVATIGKPRTPTTPNVAAYIVALDFLLVAGLLWTRGVL